MKITLLMPQSPAYRKGAAFGKHLRLAPLTLTTLAALVPPELNAEIEIIDEGVTNLNLDEINADLVGITCITPNAPRVYEFSRRLRERGIKVVIGGIHPTLMPHEVQPHADAIVTGYAEQTWPQLLRDFVAGSMHSRYQESPNYQYANVPVPRRDLLSKEGYRTLNTIQATRGCPFRCNFCVVPAMTQKKYQQRPVAEVIDEIEQLDGDEFVFLDLSPTEDVEYCKQLYRAMIPLKKKWYGLATIRIAHDREFVQLAAQSGCNGLLIGLESVSEKTLRHMIKGFNKPSQYFDAIKLLQSHGIGIMGCFVYGLDGDTPSIFEETMEFVYKASIDLPRFAIATPFPGTTLYHELKGDGRLLHENWEFYSGQNVVFQPKNLSIEQLQQGLFWSWKTAYSIPSIVRRITGSAATQGLGRLLVSARSNLGYAIYGNMVPDYVPVPCEIEPWKE